MFRSVLLRPPSSEEAALVAQTATSLERQFAEAPERAQAFLSVGDSKADASLPPARFAALSVVASQLLNLDEALNK